MFLKYTWCAEILKLSHGSTYRHHRLLVLHVEAALSSCFLSLGSSSVVIGVFVVFDRGWVELGQSRVGLSISAIVMGC